MAKILNIFFVTLGVIFLFVLLVLAYLLLADPFDLRGLLWSSQPDTFQQTQQNTNEQEQASQDDNPVLSESQEAALEGIGVDPASLPSQITPEQEVCFVEVLGQQRVDEIKAGAMPSASEFFQARGCI